MLETFEAAVDDALARSVLYRFLSVGFQSGDGPQHAADDGIAAVAAALCHLDAGTNGPLAAVADRLTALPSSVRQGASERFVALFGHTARGLVCPFETEYGPENMFQQPQQLADIAGCYLAFGLRPAASSRVDHIACACEFMDFLNRKEAVLAAQADGGADARDSLEVTRAAARSFLRDHLARFGRAFATRLANEDPDGYYAVLAHLLLAVLDAECDRLGIEAGPVELPLRPETPDDTPMACGTGQELIQIQRR